MGCGCKNKIHGYHDMSNIDPVSWDDIPYVLGLTECGAFEVAKKPEYSILTAEQAEKIDHLIIDGQEDWFLASDGNYKPIDSIHAVTLQWANTATNFAINNQKQLFTIVDNIDAGKSAFVLLDYNGVIIPLIAVRESNTLILEYDRPVVGKYLRDKFTVSLDTTIRPFNVTLYQVVRTPDADFSIGEIGNNIEDLTNRIENAENALTAETNRAVTAERQLQDNLDYVGSLLQDNINTVNGGLAQEIQDRITGDNELRADITATQGDIEVLRSDVDTNKQSIVDLTASTENAFITVNNELDSLGARVSVNETNIEINTIDIQNLRDDFTNDEKFKGYFADYDQLVAQVQNPTPGDYAYLASTGTKWAYNGTVWYDTTVPVPDQTVEASESIPQIPAGTGAVGVSNRYMRADAVVPSDPTKADVSELENYLPIAGNTQTTRVTGDVWLESGKRVRLTNSGNSNIGQNTETNTTEIVGNGVGGVDIISGNGTVKANGQEVVTYDQNDDIRAKRDIYLGNDNNLFGIGADGSVHNLIQKSRFGIIDAGSTKVPFNISSSIRPTVQLLDETGAEAHDIAFVGDIEITQDKLQSSIDTLSGRVTTNEGDIAGNSSDIEAILQRLANDENFRGYKLTTTDVTSITDPQNGNFAYNLQTGTIWVYNGTTWTDSLEPIPDGAIQAYEGNPLVNGEANPGSINEYSRGDHRHPTDTTRASATALESTNTNLSGLRNEFETYVSNHGDEVEQILGQIATNTGNISSLTSRVSSTENNISGLQSQAVQIGEQVNANSSDIADAVGRIGVNEDAIKQLDSRIENNENFKGGFITTADLTATPGSSGDFAWNYEDGFVWVYDAGVPSWVPTTRPIPSDATPLSDDLPLTNGTANSGTSNDASRSDHVHESDPTKANLSDIPTSLSELANDAGFITNSALSGYATESYVTTQLGSYATTTSVNTLTNRVTANETNIANLPVQLAMTEAEYMNLPSYDENTYYFTYEE